MLRLASGLSLQIRRNCNVHIGMKYKKASNDIVGFGDLRHIAYIAGSYGLSTHVGQSM